MYNNIIMSSFCILYSRKIWRFGSLYYYNRQIKIFYLHVYIYGDPVPKHEIKICQYSCNIIIVILVSTAKFVTIHEKTMHNFFELRPTLPTTQPLNYCFSKFGVSSPCSQWRYEQKYTRITRTKVLQKLQWILLRMLHVEVRIFAVYGKCVAPRTESTFRRNGETYMYLNSKLEECGGGGWRYTYMLC